MLTFAIAMLLSASTTATDTTAVEAEGAPTAESNETSTQDAQKVNAKPKKICRKIQSTGSRLSSGKLCKTEEEWKRFLAE